MFIDAKPWCHNRGRPTFCRFRIKMAMTLITKYITDKVVLVYYDYSA